MINVADEGGEACGTVRQSRFWIANSPDIGIAYSPIFQEKVPGGI